MNGLVKIGRTVNEAGDHDMEHLDYEQTWEDDKNFVMKCYDRNARTVYIHVDKETMLETMFGDIRQIRERNPLPPPQEGQ